MYSYILASLRFFCREVLDSMSFVLRLPPRIKVLEALGCIGDQRIKILGDKEAIVISSDGTKSYYVYVDLELKKAYSDDNGTKLRGYIGYPIIAFLMLKKAIQFDEKLAKALAGIPWKKLNETYKQYAIVEKIVFQRIKQMGINEEYAIDFVNKILNSLTTLGLRYTDISTKK